MKRHFLTGLKAFAVSALALAAVSCYDDSELWGELEGLEQRVAALEEKLNSEVATLNSKIGAVETAYKAADADLLAKLTSLDAKLVAEVAKLAADLDAADGKLDGYASAEDLKAEIEKLSKDLNGKYTELKGVDTEILAALTKVAVTKVEKNAAGNAVLTFLDGTTLEVGAADANANNTGLVTVVDGKWAIVGADGKTTVLDALVHPDTELEFKVDPKSYEVFVSYDGEEWIATGVIVKDAQTINLVTGFVDAKDHVVITVGGVEYKLPKVSTNSFDIVSGMVFFAEGETKAIPVAMEGVVSSMVAKAPAGWTIELTNEVLSVTAPAENSGDDGSGDDDYVDDMPGWPGGGIAPASELSVNEGSEDFGIIEIWVVTDDGKTFVGKLQVSLVGKFADIVVTEDEEKGVMVNLNVPKSPYPTDMDYETGEFIYGPMYYPVYFGACPVDEFDAEALCKILDNFYVGEDESNYPHIFGNYDLIDYGGGEMYPKWITDKQVALSKMLEGDIEAGTTYVVWAYNSYPSDYTNSESTFIKVYYTPVQIEFPDAVASPFDAELNISVNGVEDFYVFMTEEVTWNAWKENNFSEVELKQSNTTFKEALLYVASNGGYYSSSYKGSLNYLGISESNSDRTSNNVQPNTEYVVGILPLYPEKVNADYTLEDVYVKNVKTKKPSFEASLPKVTFGEYEVTRTSFTVPMSFEGADGILYHAFTEEYFNANFEDADEAADYVVENWSNIYGMTSSGLVEFNWIYNKPGGEPTYVTSNTKYVVLAFAVDYKNGTYGDVTTVTLATAPEPIDENITISVSESDIEFLSNGSVAVTYNVTNADYIVVNANFGSPTLASSESSANILYSNLLNQGPEYYYLKRYDVVDGKATVTYSSVTLTSYKYSVAIAYRGTTKAVEWVSNPVVTSIAGYLTSKDDFADAVAEGGVINLGENVTLTEKITISADKEVTINLRGKTVTFDNSGTAGYAILNYGKLTVSNGTIIAKGTAFAAGLYNEGEATLNCNITSENSNAIKVDKGGKLTINGGKYEAKNPTGQALRVGNWKSGEASAWELYINGGEFVGPWAGLYIVNNYVGLATAGKAEIKNASFKGSEAVVDSGVKGSDIVFDNVKNVTIEDCTLKTQSIHSETTGESVINGETITTIDNVYSTVFAAE